MTDLSTIASGGKPQRAPAQLLRILIIDSRPESRSLLKAALRGLSFVETVIERARPIDLGEFLVENPAHIVIIEEDFEEDDPFEVVKSLKRNPATARINFVLVSSHLDVESRRKGIEAGILGFLSKPYDLQTLEKAIRDALGKVSTNHKETLDKVRRISFFSGFTDEELLRLLKICHTRKFNAGEPVFHEGEKGDRLYVMLSGEVNILKRVDDDERLLATMKAGEVFGEMAIVDSEPRSADAVAASNAMMIEVHDQIINNLNDPLALKLFRKFAILVTKKLRDFTRATAEAQN